MRITFHPAARRELREARGFYEKEREGLGEEFLARIVEATKDHLGILAVAHQSRRPFYWIGRLG